MTEQQLIEHLHNEIKRLAQVTSGLLTQLERERAKVAELEAKLAQA